MRHLIPRHLLCYCLLGAILSACDKPIEAPKEEAALRLVRTSTINGASDTSLREFPGVVDAAQKADLSFRVSGELEKILVNEGERVQQGQLLAQLDATDAKIQLQRREAEYNQVNADFKRGKTLLKKRLISQSDFDKLTAQNSTSQANLDAAKKAMEYTALYAPFSGRVAKKYVENFEEVTSMQTILALQDQSSFLIKVDIPEDLVLLTKREAIPKLYAQFNAIPNQKFPLELTEASTIADQKTNTFEATFNMQAVENYNILPGMSVTVLARKPQNPDGHPHSNYVSAHAVLEDDQGRYVYVVKPVESGIGEVERRAVVIGNLSSQGLEILSGLSQGDEVITAGMSKMRAGLKVRVAKGKQP